MKSINEKVKDLNISIDVSVLKSIRDVIEKYVESNLESHLDDNYNGKGYWKVILHDGLSPFIYNDINSFKNSTVPSKMIDYNKFLKDDYHKFKFSKFLGELNSKLVKYYGNREILFRLELTKLKSKSKMGTHKDVGMYVKDRLNIMFADDKNSGFQCGDMLYPMKKNKIYRCDVTKRHRAVNYSNEDRYGLILDVVKDFSELLEYKNTCLKINYIKKHTEEAKEKLISWERLYNRVLI